MAQELKAYDLVDIQDYRSKVYIKSEADKVIAHHKYKRCLAMAKWCAMAVSRYLSEGCQYERIEKNPEQVKDCDRYTIYYDRWFNRWLKIAERFKETK